MTNLDSILKSRDITSPTKVHLVKTMVFPVVMYGCESWTIKKAECQRIDAEGGNRQNRLHLESRTLSWARLWTLSYMPSIYGNDTPTGKPDPPRWKNPRDHT